MIALLSIIAAALFTFSLFNLRQVKSLFIEMYGRKNLVFSLAKNDFKTKYSSSYLGITWGFIQPLLIILTYWFVFQVGLKSASVMDVPFILWFMVGIVPWFYFSEAWSNATNVFVEYSYLVKKVVFNIEVLPIVRIVSALIVNLFFVLLLFTVSAAYGYYPNLYYLQIIYYSMCMILLTISISYITSAVVLFFRDLYQIIGIVIQIGFWFTPIVWSYTMLSDFWLFVFKLNPMFYIVNGFRDSFINQIYFWQHPYQTIYFWFSCILLLTIGLKVFRKLRPHFSDVL
ncbi:ABC transporter permease [Paenibacillus sp. CAU 1523]|uniref:Transport permease protein n=2 Tax=Paenibacillus arenosi TaxID=2774142 RepID=A0ABR9B3Q4_9BACL|nr:ABC transporter permease [Paenibacillus arenosi]